MKKIGMLFVFGLLVSMIVGVRTASATKTEEAPAVSSAAVSQAAAPEWPDYSNWPVTEKSPMILKVEGLPTHVASLEVEVGTRTVRHDNLENPTKRVVEVDLLGNGPTVRILQTKEGDQDFQLFTDDKKWISVRPETVTTKFLHRERLLERVTGLVHTAEPLAGGPRVEMRVENKAKKRH